MRASRVLRTVSNARTFRAPTATARLSGNNGRSSSTLWFVASTHQRPLSEIAARYNGFTLGAFLASMRDKYTAPRYREFRQRVLDFLDEVQVKARLPLTQAAYQETADSTLSTVLAQVKSVSNSLYDFTGLGTMAVLQASTAAALTTEQVRILRERWRPVLERSGIRPEAYDEWLDALPKTQSRVTADQVLSPAALLLTYGLEVVKPDNDTCFIAMPFQSPFLEHFTALYRPALALINMQAVRAWGGLSSEEYYMSLQTIISRSGAMLAELATGNPNVYNEIGIAHGTLRPVFLVCRAPGEDVPSNIGHLPVCVYDDRNRRWQVRERRRLAEYMVWVLQEFERRYAPAYRQFLAENLEPRMGATSDEAVKGHSGSSR